MGPDFILLSWQTLRFAFLPDRAGLLAFGTGHPHFMALKEPRRWAYLLPLSDSSKLMQSIIIYQVNIQHRSFNSRTERNKCLWFQVADAWAFRFHSMKLLKLLDV